MRRRNGFTLVELLVVIGIIAILVSVLMPALNAARSSAKLVACQANMRSIYQAINFYSLQYKGMLPRQSDENFEFQGTNCDTHLEITRLLGTQFNDPSQIAGALHPAMKCTEAWDEAGVVWAANLIRTIKFHPRAFPGYNSLGSIPQEYPQRKLASIRNSAEKIALYEGQQLLTWNETTEPDSIFFDGWRWNWSHMYLDPPPDGATSQARWEQPIESGPNVDGNWWDCGMRFRHNKNKSSPICFFDGHIEMRRMREVKVKEVCISK